MTDSVPTGSVAGETCDELVLLVECDRPLAGSTRHRLRDVDEVRIGRGAQRSVERYARQLTVRVPDGRVSSAHAAIRREGGGLFLHDTGAKNGVVVNGARVDRHLLRDGDLIECGRTFFVFRVARTRPANEPADADFTPAAMPAIAGLATLHEPLAAQLRALAAVARSSIPVLVLGPTGTGKELVARAIHTMSHRTGSFVGVNCGALPENLVEAELFGARRGSFTGASEERVGLVRTSDQGTLFLDEIGDLPQRAQPTLLRTLQEREVLPIGGTRPLPVDLRVVAATHHDLNSLMRNQQFRADLLSRLSGFVVRLPTLRERIDDLGMLVATLLLRHAGNARPAVSISPDAMRLLLRHEWPLNIRELEHCLRAALALAETRIEAAHLPPSVRNPGGAGTPLPVALTRPPRRVLTPEQQARREELRALLVQFQGNISQVARVMGKDRVQIRRWIRLFELSPDRLQP